ncbi:MAG: hypothetical protein CMF62_02045 [Magnetococcales bacterium]|nr:hypothetical protein [Magnetococcales bacterium]|tara:strand:+ start:144306 stop:146168 length:1863 start_codon:yes stop_codon:yes gene_type:complete
MTDKKIICRLDDYLNGVIDQSRICTDTDDLFLDLSYDPKKSFDKLYTDRETCEKECGKSANIVKKFVYNTQVKTRMKKDINFEELNKLKVPKIFIQDPNLLNIKSVRKVFENIKDDNYDYSIYFINYLIENFSNLFYFDFDNFPDATIHMDYDSYDNSLNKHSVNLLSDIFYKPSYQIAFDEGKSILLSLTIENTEFNYGHMGIVLITKKNEQYDIYVYDSSSKKTSNFLQSELDMKFSEIKYEVTSLNKGYFIQKIEKHDINESINDIKKNHFEEYGFYSVLDCFFIDDLKKAFDSMLVYDESKIDQKLKDKFGYFFNLRIIYENLKDLDKDEFTMKLNKIMDNYYEYADSVFNSFSEAIYDKLEQNKNLEKIFDNFKNFCTMFSTRFAIILALNFNNPDLDLFNLAKIDINKEIIEELVSEDLYIEISKIIYNYEYKEDKIVINDETNKLIKQIIDKKINNYNILNLITKKLNNNLLFVILTMSHIYFENSSNENTIDGFIQRITKTINLNSLINITESNFKKLIYDSHIQLMNDKETNSSFISKCFEYLKSTSISYKDEQNILKYSVIPSEKNLLENPLFLSFGSIELSQLKDKILFNQDTSKEVLGGKHITYKLFK